MYITGIRALGFSFHGHVDGFFSEMCTCDEEGRRVLGNLSVRVFSFVFRLCLAVLS